MICVFLFFFVHWRRRIAQANPKKAVSQLSSMSFRLQSDNVQTTFDKIERLEYNLPASASPQAKDLIRQMLQKVCGIILLSNSWASHRSSKSTSENHI
jgi:hypothetical protein